MIVSPNAVSISIVLSCGHFAVVRIAKILLSQFYRLESLVGREYEVIIEGIPSLQKWKCSNRKVIY